MGTNYSYMGTNHSYMGTNYMGTNYSYKISNIHGNSYLYIIKNIDFDKIFSKNFVNFDKNFNINNSFNKVEKISDKVLSEILLINLIVKVSSLLHFLMSQAFSKEACLKKITIFKNQLTNPKIYLANLKTYLVIRYAYIKIENMIRCKLPKTNRGFNNINCIHKMFDKRFNRNFHKNFNKNSDKNFGKSDKIFLDILFLDTQNLSKLSIFVFCSIYFTTVNYICIIKVCHAKKHTNFLQNLLSFNNLIFYHDS